VPWVDPKVRQASHPSHITTTRGIGSLRKYAEPALNQLSRTFPAEVYYFPGG
jgi:hypothetical protein